MAESGYIQELRNKLAQTSDDNMANQMNTQSSLQVPIQQAVQQEQTGALQSYQNTTPSTETNNSIAYSAYLNRSGSAAEALKSSNTAFDLSALMNKYMQAVNDLTLLKNINDNARSEFLSSISGSSGSGSSGSGVVATMPTATQDTETVTDTSNMASGGQYNENSWKNIARTTAVSVTKGSQSYGVPSSAKSGSLQYNLIQSDINKYIKKLSKSSAKKTQAQLSQDYLYYYDKLTEASGNSMPQELLNSFESQAQAIIEGAK